MELQTIDVFIDKSGNVQFEVKGVKGSSCLDLTKALEEALGGEVERELTHEYHEQAEVRQQQIRQEQGDS